MQEFINHAKHNEKFHELICNAENTGYYDWKVTVLFYVAIHYLKALAQFRKKSIGESHEQINNNIKNNRQGATMPLQNTARNNYMALYRYSQTSRYDGFTDADTFQQLMKRDYEDALECLSDFKKYIASSKVPV